MRQSASPVLTLFTAQMKLKIEPHHVSLSALSRAPSVRDGSRTLVVGREAFGGPEPVRQTVRQDR